MQRWKWDRATSALTPDGAALQMEGSPVTSFAVAPGPDGELQLLAGCFIGALRVLGNVGGDGALQQQAELAGHSETVPAVVVMAPPSACQ